MEFDDREKDNVFFDWMLVFDWKIMMQSACFAIVILSLATYMQSMTITSVRVNDCIFFPIAK